MCTFECLLLSLLFVQLHSYLDFQDSIALIVQAVGGGIASSATTLQGTVDGGHIMLGGIVFQLAVAVLYSILALEYLTRWKLDKLLRIRVSNWERRNGNVSMDARTKTMLVGLGLLTLFIIVRCDYFYAIRL